MTKLLQNHVILITGASRGIGAGVAKRLAQEGAHVVLCARSVEGLEQVDDEIQALTGEPATILPLDLSDHDKIDALGPALLERFDRLDGFIGNAAILGQVTPLTHHDPKQFQKVLDVNVTANWRLLRILDPLLRRSTHPRVAFVTSAVTQSVSPFWGAYALSKHALESLSMTYAEETKDTAMRVSLIDPKIVATDMRAQAYPGEDKAKLTQIDDPRLTDLFVEAMRQEVVTEAKRVLSTA